MSGIERTVHRRMIAILEELPAIGKNQKNQQQGFMFRGHDDILNALNPLLAKHGVVVVPDVLDREISQRTTSKGGVMYEVNLHVRYRFYGAGGDYVEASTWGEGTDSGDKATNKAMTMAFKNVLNQAFAISSAEFRDADAESPEATTGRASSNGAEPRSPAQNRKVFALIKDLETLHAKPWPPHADWKNAIEARCGELWNHGLADITKTEASTLIEDLTAYVKQLMENPPTVDAGFQAPEGAQSTLSAGDDDIPF